MAEQRRSRRAFPRTEAFCATRSQSPYGHISRSSSPSRLRATARAVPAVRWSTWSIGRDVGLPRTGRSVSFTSRSTRTTIREKARTAGSREWRLPSEPGRSSSAVMVGSSAKFEGSISSRDDEGEAAAEEEEARARSARRRRRSCIHLAPRGALLQAPPWPGRHRRRSARRGPLGRVLRVHREAVDGFLARQRVKPTRFQPRTSQSHARRGLGAGLPNPRARSPREGGVRRG